MDRQVNMNRRQPRERGRGKAFVALACLRCMHRGGLVFLILFGSVFAFGAPASAIPKRDGILRIARPTDPQTLDQALLFTGEDAMLSYLVHLPLLDVMGGTNVVPCAAESWSASADQRVFTIHLRPGVKFSNGREVQSSDYVYALERILDPATASPQASLLSDIRGAEAFMAGKTNHLVGVTPLSPSALCIELEHSDATFPYNLWCTAMPREAIVGHADHYRVRPVCTGPYMVESWVRGARLKLTRNPHYQGPEPQHLEGVDVLIGGDETTHLMMFERGELDIANITGEGIPRPSFRRLSQDPLWRDRIERAPLFYTHFISLNNEIPPLSNVLVRRAINHAIDRDRRMQVALGFNSHSEGMLPPIMPGYNPRLRGYPYDPERARQLLRESGLPLPLRTELWHDTSDVRRTLAQGIQWDLKQVGIEVKLRAVAISQLVDAIGTRGKVSMVLIGWGASLPDPKDLIGSLFDGNAIASTGSKNQSFYNNPEVTRLLHEAAVQVDWQLRFKLYQRAEEMIVEDAPYAFLGHQNGFALRQPWLKGPLLEPLMWYRFDRVWFEK
jgi:oligopeptide transport system substrate-binding protein